MSNATSYKKINIKLIIILLISILFFVFWVLKINGYFDFSSNYGIEMMQTYYQTSDSLLMIDNNAKSTWGIRGDVHFYDEPMYIKFTKARPISKIKIVNNSEYKDTPVNIYVSSDGQNYYYEEYSVSNTKAGELIYTFNNSVMAQYVLMVKCDEETTWPISELIIYD